jgi:phosphoribosylanthranilate isomerase
MDDNSRRDVGLGTRFSLDGGWKNMVRVKICGIRSREEAEIAVAAGADAIGLLVGQIHESPDFISAETAREICAALGPFVVPVLVTHLTDLAAITELAQQVPAWAIQLHSDLSCEALHQLRRTLAPRKLLGKVSVEGPGAVARALEIDNFVDALLLDTCDRATNRVGGTGLVHDWNLSSQIARQSRVPVILAGGLTAANVVEAIDRVHPWGVDVNTGVKGDAGRKSAVRCGQFVCAAKTVRSSG